MSVVGPRPLLMQYLDRYTPGAEVKPGLTGWAQVNGHNSFGRHIVLSWRDDFVQIVVMNSDSLKYVLRQFAERTLPVSRPRELVLPTGSGKVVGLAGVRRSGKTFLFGMESGRTPAQLGFVTGPPSKCTIDI